MNSVKRWHYEAQAGVLHGACYLSGSEDFVRATDYDAAVRAGNALRLAIDRFNLDCYELHHDKSQEHKVAPCPVIAEITAALAQWDSIAQPNSERGKS